MRTPKILIGVLCGTVLCASAAALWTSRTHLGVNELKTTWGHECQLCYKGGWCDTKLPMEGEGEGAYSYCDGEAGAVLWLVEGERVGGSGPCGDPVEEDPTGCGTIQYYTPEKGFYSNGDPCGAVTEVDPDDMCT
jgi:hypothetical protein